MCRCRWCTAGRYRQFPPVRRIPGRFAGCAGSGRSRQFRSGRGSAGSAHQSSAKRPACRPHGRHGGGSSPTGPTGLRHSCAGPAQGSAGHPWGLHQSGRPHRSAKSARHPPAPHPGTPLRFPPPAAGLWFRSGWVPGQPIGKSGPSWAQNRCHRNFRPHTRQRR